MRRLALALIGILALSASCGGSDSATTPPPTINPSGAWTSLNGSTRLTMTITAPASGGAVTGTGTITQAASLALTITGTYAPPNLSLNMAAPGFQTLNFTGTAKATQLIGSLTGSGFVNVTWIFDRQ